MSIYQLSLLRPLADGCAALSILGLAGPDVPVFAFTWRKSNTSLMRHFRFDVQARRHHTPDVALGTRILIALRSTRLNFAPSTWNRHRTPRLSRRFSDTSPVLRLRFAVTASLSACLSARRDRQCPDPLEHRAEHSPGHVTLGQRSTCSRFAPPLQTCPERTWKGPHSAPGVQ